MNTSSATSPAVIHLPSRVDTMGASKSHAIIRLPSRVDSAIFPFFQQDLKQKIRPGVTLIIDMAKTKFIEPATASVFWEGVLQSHREGAKIVARGMNDQVKLVFERSGLLPHLQ